MKKYLSLLLALLLTVSLAACSPADTAPDLSDGLSQSQEHTPVSPRVPAGTEVPDGTETPDGENNLAESLKDRITESREQETNADETADTAPASDTGTSGQNTEPAQSTQTEPESGLMQTESENAPTQSEPEPDPDPEPQSVTVYITKTGEKYHRDGCQYLSKSQIAIDLDQAKLRGYTACSRCNPPA